MGTVEAETDDARQRFKVLTFPMVAPFAGSAGARVQRIEDDLRAFLNDPIALIARAKALLEDRTSALLSIWGSVSLVRFTASILLQLFAVDVPGDVDNLARLVATAVLDWTDPRPSSNSDWSDF